MQLYNRSASILKDHFVLERHICSHYTCRIQPGRSRILAICALYLMDQRYAAAVSGWAVVDTWPVIQSWLLSRDWRTRAVSFVRLRWRLTFKITRYSLNYSKFATIVLFKDFDYSQARYTLWSKGEELVLWEFSWGSNHPELNRVCNVVVSARNNAFSGNYCDFSQSWISDEGSWRLSSHCRASPQPP